MTTKKQSERDEFIAKLRETLKPGDTVHTVLRSVSRSGMNRKIDVYKLTGDGNGGITKQWLSYWVAKACDFRFDEKSDALSIGGCGMDMGAHVVYNLSRVLFRDAFECIGEKCPANDHSNAWYAEKAGKCAVCGGVLMESCQTRDSRGHKIRVCSSTCANGPWKHSDAGYALRQEWL